MLLQVTLSRVHIVAFFYGTCICWLLAVENVLKRRHEGLDGDRKKCPEEQLQRVVGVEIEIETDKSDEISRLETYR